MSQNNDVQRTDHEDEEDDLLITRKPFFELEKHAKEANEKLRIFLMGLSQPEMIARIKQLDLSDKSLNFLCEGIALEKEDYEICMAVEVIKKRTGHGNIGLMGGRELITLSTYLCPP